jgi:dienelactone hydrolase
VIGRFEQFSFASGRLVHPVYYAGDRQAPPVLLLPEIAGFSPGLHMFADRLIDARFRVFVPWLFGPLGKRRHVATEFGSAYPESLPICARASPPPSRRGFAP